MNLAIFWVFSVGFWGNFCRQNITNYACAASEINHENYEYCNVENFNSPSNISSSLTNI